MRVLVLCACLAAATISADAQRSRDIPRSSGGGELSPSVVATWEAHGEPQRSAPGPASMTLDLLVLWRGKPGWLMTQPSQSGENASLFAGPGFPDRGHQVWVRGRKLELRVDSKTNTAVVEGKEVSLQGVNVVMIDGVDTGKITLATLWVEPTLSATTDLSEVLRQSTTLQDFVKK